MYVTKNEAALQSQAVEDSKCGSCDCGLADGSLAREPEVQITKEKIDKVSAAVLKTVTPQKDTIEIVKGQSPEKRDGCMSPI